MINSSEKDRASLINQIINHLNEAIQLILSYAKTWRLLLAYDEDTLPLPEQATQFRIWATQVLKDHLIQGYTLYNPRLAQQGFHELQQTLALLQRTLKQHECVNELGEEKKSFPINTLDALKGSQYFIQYPSKSSKNKSIDPNTESLKKSIEEIYYQVISPLPRRENHYLWRAFSIRMQMTGYRFRSKKALPDPHEVFYPIILEYLQVKKNLADNMMYLLALKEACWIEMKYIAKYTLKLPNEEIGGVIRLRDYFFGLQKENLPIDLALFKKYLTPEQLEEISQCQRSSVINLKEIPFSMDATSADETSIAICTQIVGKTLGDYYAALSLIKSLQKKSPHLKIFWFIIGRAKNIPNELEETEKLAIYEISSYKTLLEENQPISNHLHTVCAIFMFPVFYQIVEFDQDVFAKRNECEWFIENLKQKYKIPIFGCAEYSSFKLFQYTFMHQTAMGLAPDELGVYTSEQTPKPLFQIESSHMISTILFGDPDVLAKREEYLKTTRLYAGHANKMGGKVLFKDINVPAFILACIRITKKEAPECKNEDFVLPITDKELSVLLPHLQHYACVELIKEENGYVTRKVLHENNNKGAIQKLRIISVRLDNPTFRLIIQGSHPFKMGTGDGSWSDIISSIHAIVFYQTMNWKRQHYENYVKIAEQLLGENSIAVQYLRLSKPFNKDSDSINIELVDEIVDLVTNPELLKQLSDVHQYIVDHKSCNDALPEYVLKGLKHLLNGTLECVTSSKTCPDPELLRKSMLL